MAADLDMPDIHFLDMLCDPAYILLGPDAFFDPMPDEAMVGLDGATPAAGPMMWPGPHDCWSPSGSHRSGPCSSMAPAGDSPGAQAPGAACALTGPGKQLAGRSMPPPKQPQADGCDDASLEARVLAHPLYPSIVRLACDCRLVGGPGPAHPTCSPPPAGARTAPRPPRTRLLCRRRWA